jgi:hypothetical protein
MQPETSPYRVEHVLWKQGCFLDLPLIVDRSIPAKETSYHTFFVRFGGFSNLRYALVAKKQTKTQHATARALSKKVKKRKPKK